MLWQKIEATPDIQTVFGEVESVCEQSDSVTLRLTDRSIEADLLVASDGARSGVRNYLRVPTQIRPTAQVALTTVVALEQAINKPHGSVFGGWAFGLLPVSTEVLLGSVVAVPAIPTNLAVSDEVFCQRIGRAMESRFGEVTAVAQRLSFPYNNSWPARHSLCPSPADWRCPAGCAPSGGSRGEFRF